MYYFSIFSSRAKPPQASATIRTPWEKPIHRLDIVGVFGVLGFADILTQRGTSQEKQYQQHRPTD